MNASRKNASHRLVARVAIIAALAMPFTAPRADAQARWVVKLGTAAFDQAPLASMLTRVGEALEREHPGRFWVKRIVDGALARDTPGLARVATGEAHGYAATFDEIVEALPGAAALGAPFAFDNQRDADAVLRGAGGAALSDAFAAQGIRLVAIAPCEARVLAGRTPFTSPKDAAGMSIARRKGPTHAAFVAALSLKPLDVAEQPDVHEGTLSELAASGALGSASHVVLTDHALECGALVLSQRWIDGLPEQMQKTLNLLSRELGEDATRAQRAAREKILERAKTQLEVITLDAKQRRAFVEATRAARTQLNGEPGSLARKLTLAAQAK